MLRRIGKSKTKLPFASILIVCLMISTISFMVFTVATPVYAEDLLNGSFETDSNSDGIPDYWYSNIYAGSPVFQLDSTQSYEGTKSIKITGNTTSDRCSAVYHLTGVDNMVGKTYKFSIWQKTSNITSSSYGTCVRILFWDSTNKTMKPNLIVPGAKGTTAGWTRIEFNFTVPYGTTHMYIEPFLWQATGTVWWDLASLEFVNNIANPGFETDSNSDGIPDNWANWYNAGTPTFLIDNTNSYEGTKSQKITGATTADLAESVQTYNVSQICGLSYKLTAWQKTQNIVSNSYGTVIRVMFKDASLNDTRPQLFIAGAKGTTAGWNKLEAGFTIPEGTVTLYVELFLYQASGTVWWDNVQMQEYTTGPVVNQSFENDYESTGIPYAWDRTLPANGTGSFDTTVKKQGNKSYTMVITGTRADASLSQQLIIPVTWTNRLYKFSTWIKTDNVASDLDGTLVKLEFYDGSGGIYDPLGNSIGNPFLIPGFKGTNDWTKLEGTFAVPEGTKKIKLSLCMTQASGTVWWDLTDVVPLQLLTNSSFDVDDNCDGIAEGWTNTISTGTPTITLDNTIYYDGSRSVKMTGSLTTDACRVTQIVTLPTGRPNNLGYKFSVYQKTQNIVADKVTNSTGTHIDISFRNNAGQLTGSYAVIMGYKGTMDWTRLEKAFAIPYGTTRIYIDIYLRGSGTVWYDKADLTPVELLYNKDFEIDGDGNSFPDDWSWSIINGSPTAAIDTNDYYYPNPVAVKSLKITPSTANDQAVLSQTIALSSDFSTGGKFSVAYKTDTVVPNSDIGGAYAKLTFLNSAGAQTGNILYLKGINSTILWSTMAKTFTPPTGAVKLKIELYNCLSSGTIWWDMAELTAAPCPQPEPPIISTTYGYSFMEGTPTITWNSVNNASTYTIQYSQDPNFLDASTSTITDLTNTSYAITSQLAEGKWYCHAKAVDTSGSSTTYAPVNKFFIQRLVASTDKNTPNNDGANDSTSLSYSLQNTATVTLRILDSGGIQVKMLVNSQSQNSGFYRVSWDGRNDSGVLVSNGTYTARLTLVSGTTIDSTATISVDAADIAGYCGLENNKDWSNFYDDWLEKSVINIYNDQDSTTGRYTRVLSTDPWSAAHTAGYAYIMANAYHRSSSSYYNNAATLDKAIKAFDYLASYELDASGSWGRARYADPNIDRFALAPLADAYMLLQDNVDSTKRTTWLQLLQRAAEYQMDTYPYDSIAGEYPNQDANYVLVLGLVGTITNDTGLLNEADRMLGLMQDDLMPNGGFNYIKDSNPNWNYQNLALSLLARYYTVTGNSDVSMLLQNAGNYYPSTAEFNGYTEYSTAGDAKQLWLTWEQPGGADTVAYFTGDGKNKMVANIIKEKLTHLFKEGFTSMTETYFTYCAIGVSTSMTPVKLNNSGVVKDPDIHGFRGKWDDFSTALTSTKYSNTLASVTLFNNSDVFSPVEGGVGWSVFESKKGSLPAPNYVDHSYILNDDVQQSVITRQSIYESNIGVQYTDYIPVYGSSLGDWQIKQTWILFRDRLIGMNTMSCRNSGSGKFARSRLIFTPSSSKATLGTEIVSNNLYASFGLTKKIGVWISSEANDAWEFNTSLNGSLQPGNAGWGGNWQQVALQKKSDESNVVQWTTADKMSYHSVYFPLGSYSTARQWHDDTNANNILFSDPQTDVHATRIDADDGTGIYYAIIANHGSVASSSNLIVTLSSGNYTLKKYSNDSGTEDSSQDITVTNGSYSLAYDLVADSAVVFKFIPR